MSKTLIPPKLKAGDTIAIITPSLAKNKRLPWMSQTAQQRLEKAGFRVVWSPSTTEGDELGSTSVTARARDIMWAFQNSTVQAIWCFVGGFNANQLLDELDWQTIAKNPKIFVGHSDNTVLCNAIRAKTNLVTYYGPNVWSFASQTTDYMLESLRQALIDSEDYLISPPPVYTQWTKGLRTEVPTTRRRSFEVLSPGSAEGVLIGGNASTFYLLQGTPYMPRFEQNTILLLEDDDATAPFTLQELDRRLTSVLQQTGASRYIQGILIGRFETQCKVDMQLLRQVIGRQPALRGKPVIANIPIGHTEPKCLLPIGGIVRIQAQDKATTITVQAKTRKEKT